jgi:hypothetical protein
MFSGCGASLMGGGEEKKRKKDFLSRHFRPVGENDDARV